MDVDDEEVSIKPIRPSLEWLADTQSPAVRARRISVQSRSLLEFVTGAKEVSDNQASTVGSDDS